jgi:hypothetical protein
MQHPRFPGTTSLTILAIAKTLSFLLSCELIELPGLGVTQRESGLTY